MVRVDAATGWSLGLWFVLGLVPTVGQSVGWHALLNHQGLAAWVQAVGSIAAIAAAIYVASSQHRQDVETRRAASAEAVALRMALIAHVAERVDWLLALLTVQQGGDCFEIIDAMAWDKSARRLTTLKRALDAVDFATLQHHAEFLLMTEARGALDDVASTLSIIAAASTDGVSGPRYLDMRKNQLLLTRVGERYKHHIERNWAR